MLARLLWGILAVEAALYAALVALLATLGAPLWLLVGLPIASFVALRAMITGHLVRTAYRHQAPAPPGAELRPLGWWALYLRELGYIIALYTVFFPLAPLWAPRPRKGERGMPVLLLHGYFCNRAYWWYMGRALRTQGLGPIYSYTVQPPFTTIDDHTARVAQRVQAIKAETGAPRLAIVGHSMGGLMARAYVLDQSGADHCAGIVTLGSPHHGTLFARGGHGKNAQQMRPDSAWLAALNAKAWPDHVPIVSLWSWQDNICFPQDTGKLDVAENIAYHGIGHMEMAFHARVIADTAAALQRFAADAQA